MWKSRTDCVPAKYILSPDLSHCWLSNGWGGIVLTLGVYASTDSSPVLDDVSKSINSIAGQCPDVLQAHGFLGDEAAHTVMFDLVVNLSADACQVRDALVSKLETQYPGWTFSVVLDTDAAD